MGMPPLTAVGMRNSTSRDADLVSLCWAAENPDFSETGICAGGALTGVPSPSNVCGGKQRDFPKASAWFTIIE
jgi:hypothetical protein